MPTRRTFAKTVAALSAASYARALGANDRIRVGFIGVGNRGDQLLDAFLPHADCQVVALCDVYEPYLPAANKKAGGSAKLLRDYRELIGLKDVDAVVIATPDHWHALTFVDACRAGKDVYVEKPVSLTIGEGRVMCRVADETKRVTQVGFHRRSTPFVREAVELVRGGGIGKVSVCQSFFHRNETPMGIGPANPAKPPAGLDWDRWLGPAPEAAYRTNSALYKFRWFPHYSGGQITNMGAHYLDVFQWALGQDAPKAVACLGGNYAVNDGREIPDTLQAVWQYDGCLVTFSQFNGNGAPGNTKGWSMMIRGSKGTLLLADGAAGYEIVPESVRLEELPALSPIARAENRRQGRAVKPAGKPRAVKGAAETATLHARNFLDCVKTRKPTHCPVETGHRSTTATLLGKLALERRRVLTWDAKAERVTDDEAANKLLTYEYRKPWKLG
ncbi:MAG TPA: Gfo/Idh/MocA family oxidoreductase [Fimbriiglobus sp.]|nr:Gfo/Idh/MocA family oxidoreductase [Fimbriiglobus sp.]